MLHINKHEVYLIENQKQRETKIKVIKGYIQRTLSNIVYIASTTYKSRRNSLLICLKISPNCSVDTRVKVLSTIGQDKSQKILLVDVAKVARFFLVKPAKNASNASCMVVERQVDVD